MPSARNQAEKILNDLKSFGLKTQAEMKFVRQNSSVELACFKDGFNAPKNGFETDNFHLSSFAINLTFHFFGRNFVVKLNLACKASQDSKLLRVIHEGDDGFCLGRGTANNLAQHLKTSACTVHYACLHPIPLNK